MGSAIGLWGDFDGAALRRLSRTTKSTRLARRLLALAEIHDGSSRRSVKLLRDQQPTEPDKRGQLWRRLMRAEPTEAAKRGPALLL